MRRLAPLFAVIALVAAGLFAAVSIANGGGLSGITTTGTGLTTTLPGKVTLCHRTGSAKHPFVAISVGAPAARAHLKHGDVLGSCTAATVASMKRHGKGKGPVKHSTATTGTTTQATATTHAPGNSGTHGNSGEHGNGGGNGNGGNNGNNGHGGGGRH